MDPIVAVFPDASASTASPEVLGALAAVRTLGPALLLAILVTLITSRKPTPIVESPSDVTEHDPSQITPVTVSVLKPRRTAILTILTLSALSYLLDGAAIVVQAVVNKTWEGSSPQWSGIEVADVIGLVAFGGLVIVGSWKDAKGFPVWQSGRIKFFALIALAFEIAHVVLLFLIVRFEKRGTIGIPERPPYPSFIQYLHVACAAFRLLLLLPLYPLISRPIVQYVPAAPTTTEVNGEVAAGSSSVPAPSGSTETSSLLAPPPIYTNGDGQKKQYGTFLPPPSTAPSSINGSITPPPSNAGVFTKPVRQKPSSVPVTDTPWSEMFQKISKLTPYLWPKKSKKLQFLASICVILLLIGRAVNFLLPLTLRELVDTFDKGTTSQRSPWAILLVYVLLKFLQGAGGLNALRDVLWAPVMQYSDREMSQLSFDHLLNLSLAFHTRKKTGEILRILDRGAAINHIFELLLFNIIPTILDIMVAVGAFFYFFGYVLSGVVLVVFALYVIATTQLTKWRTQLRRAMNERDIITRGIHTDSLLNYETVKYFGGEAHESARYAEAIAQYQALEYKVIATLNLLNFVQNFIISTGLLVGSLIVSWRVVHAGQTAADFIFFVTYLAQLYGPLNTLGYIYRSINQNLIDTEKLINLLNEPTDVKDKPDATDLIITDGAITFDHVSFSYDGRTTALKDLSFQVPKGHSVALVGESGSGKSTILRLLFRQYDLSPGQGRILIDGQDIRDVKQVSLRNAIGVVPQDSILFNSSIAYNIGYGKFGAPQEEIEAAAKAAQMHDRILSFPDGYDTKVGERGVRLSGGEKQRISIARTFLKNAPILALDEATSALDTSTEKDIQHALQNLLTGRSSISIAHRLSTIAHADIILVLKDGEIIESGSHKELLALNGVFASMWAEQINDRIGESAGVLVEAPPASVKGYELEVPTDRHTTSDLPQVDTPQPLTPADPDGQSQAPQSETVDISESPVEPRYLPGSTGPADVPSPITEESDKPTFAEIAADKPESGTAPIAFPSSSDAPVAFPTSSSAPVSFPTAEDDIASVAESKKESTAGGITFKDQETPPSRPGETVEKEKKRNRISSQNLQRLARRISIGRRPSSGPGSLKDSETPVLSREGSASGTHTPRRQDSIDLNPGSSSASAGEERPSTPASGEEGSKSKMASLLKPLRKPTRRGSLF